MRRRCAILVALAGIGAACSQSSREVHLAVWRYQLASYADNMGRKPICIGVREAHGSAAHDPAPELIAALNEEAVRVRPVSACQTGSRNFILGPAAHESGEGLVEASGLDGTYRYRLRRTAGEWRVVGGAMLTVY